MTGTKDDKSVRIGRVCFAQPYPSEIDIRLAETGSRLRLLAYLIKGDRPCSFGAYDIACLVRSYV